MLNVDKIIGNVMADVNKSMDEMNNNFVERLDRVISLLETLVEQTAPVVINYAAQAKMGPL